MSKIIPREELELGNGQYLVGVVHIEDTSFAHEFGTQKEHTYEIHDLEVWVDVLGTEIDITKLCEPYQISKFKEHWIEQLQKRETE